MALKDYYQILQVDPSADQREIKKVFRRLAMEYHPDRHSTETKHDDNSHFRDIKEAYEILSDPIKREHYHYDRWLYQSLGTKMHGHLTAYQMYQSIIESEKYLSGIDHFRKNHYALLNMLLTLFSIPRIQTILAEKNQDLEKKIILMAMKMAGLLRSDCERQFKERLNMVLIFYPTMNSTWESSITNKIADERKSKFTIPIMLLIVIALCMLFYFYANR
jgi:curved DNA-binding protein CbpA